MKIDPKPMGKPLLLLCFLTLGFNLYAESAPIPDRTESAFELQLRREIILSTLAAGVFLGSFLTDESLEMPNLSKDDVNFIDRQLMFHYRFDVVRIILSPVLSTMPVIVPIALAGGILSNFSIWLTWGVMYAQAAAFTYGIRQAMGRMIDRNRPYQYLVDWDRPIRASSFPSGTTAMAFMPATFLSVTFSTEFPDSPWRIPIIVGSHTLAAFVGTGRIIFGSHFLTDVLAGATIGSFFGWLIPTLHRRPPQLSNDENHLSFNFVGNGAVMSIRF